MQSDADDATIVISRKRGGYRDWLRSYVISTVRDREPITFGGRHLLTHGGDLARGAE